LDKEKDKKKFEDKRETRLGELRAAPQEGDTEKMVVEGYAVVFDTPATHWGFTEIIDRNAFVGADMKDVPMRYNHNDEVFIMARTRNNSLTLTVDDKGLFIRAELIDTQSNRDLYKSIQAGLLDKMSFAFSTAKDEWNYDTDTRRVTQIDKLFDVSVVDTPFYDTTSIYARALSDLEKHKRSLESEKTLQLEIEKYKSQLLMKG
jgi:HK97 family phage prohead protease